MLGIEDMSVLERVVAAEAEEPVPRKELADRTIYLSRNFGDFRGIPGRPKISDFGSAVRGTSSLQYGPIQPDCLRAPEVILQAGWTYSVDIWNLGVMVSSELGL